MGRIGSALRVVILVVVLVLVVGGCGDEGHGGPVSLASPAPSSSASGAPGGHGGPGGSGDGYAVGDPVPAEGAVLLTESAAGGRGSARARVLREPDDLDAFVAPFGSRLRARVTGAVARAEPDADEVVVAAVVDLGCDPPERVRVERVPGGVEVSRADKPDPELSCYVAMTTVAVLIVPAAAVAPAA